MHDPLIRAGVRRIVSERLGALTAAGPAAKRDFVEQCRKSPVPLVPPIGGARHEDVPPAFFAALLGPRLADSCALWDGAATLADAEGRMLAATALRAGIEDGMAILDLGSGWGSFALWAAERFPRSRVVALSNSNEHGRALVDRARRRGLYHVTATTADVSRFEAQGRFDRVVAIELFEHVRHHERLLARIARWLAPDGRLFVQHACHREFAYPYEDRGRGDWMARHFLSGGMMPSADWLSHFDEDLVAEQRWLESGAHYAATHEAWLARLDAARNVVLPLLAEAYGPERAVRWLERWRIFLLTRAELFAHRGGSEWGVAHVLLAPRV